MEKCNVTWKEETRRVHSKWLDVIDYNTESLMTNVCLMADECGENARVKFQGIEFQKGKMIREYMWRRVLNPGLLW